MIYAAQYLFRETVDPSGTYDLVLEDNIDVTALMQPSFRFYNPDGVDIRFRLVTTVAQSGLFSDSYTEVDEAVPTGTFVSHSFTQPLVRNGLVTNSIRYTNNDTAERVLYGVLTGWADIKTVLTNYIGTQP